ncbi:hypothetical protein TraAM80_05028 [Trypanosoma rangeli]|uniref:Uncharacterized protein n=1 Tax=Trypanosoma rangeli TaxID=5698 RepID=A0A3R7NMJ4_TRYRA|nr:uncharacterized protein TraAM80_05028 [Trypanosoma rangeli]RNF04890.1 hypothetical protein TraAM80_05028 [Trypanosoma rangeli]|eukprot:RNF04890.1 hypothetical protein TraAM80_05028 [Trypanosoma rangeli]
MEDKSFVDCNMRLVTIPFGINGLECYGGEVGMTRPHLISPLSMPGAVRAGARGVQELSLRGSQEICKAEKSLVMISLHNRGRLLVWDADALEVVAMCNHNGCSVVQCVVTATYLYVRVENGRDHTDADTQVYVWDAKAFTLVRRLSSHEARVTSIAVSDENDLRLATASLDNSVHIWDLQKSVTGPLKRIALNGTGLVSLYSHGLILGSSSNNTMMVWNAETGAELKRHKEAEATVTVVRWRHAPSRIIQSGASKYENFSSLLIGYSNGFIKEWTFDANATVLMTPKWGNKVHKAHVTDLCSDDDAVLSCSTFDGAFLLLQSQGHVAPLVSYGVRIVVLDSYAKNAVVGVDNGSIKIFHYRDFLEGHGQPYLLSSFCPHSSGITGLFLQLRDNFTWDRIICAGADGTVVFLDYTRARGSRLMRGLNASSVDAIPGGEAILAPLGTGGGIRLFNPVDLIPVPQEHELKTSHVVTALRWVASTFKVLVGCENGSMMLFECVMGEPCSPSFHMLEERNVSPYFPRCFFCSQPDGRLAVANLQRDQFAGKGAFLVLDPIAADLSYPIHPLTPMFPLRSSIFTFTSSEIYDYTVVVQLRDGMMMQYVGDSIRKTLPVLLRTLVSSLLSNVFQKESTGFLIFPSNYILKCMPTGGGKLNFVLTYAEGTVLHQMAFGVEHDCPVNRYVFCKSEEFDFSGSLSSDGDDVLTLEAIGQGEMAMAILRDNPVVDIIDNGGKYIYRILNTGCVWKCQASPRRRRSRGFCIGSSTSNTNVSYAPTSSPYACTASFCAEAHYLAIGYRDGLVQLFDTTQQTIFARFKVHTSMVDCLWSFPSVVVSSSVENVLHAGRVLPRVIFDDCSSSCWSPSEGSLLLQRTSTSVSAVEQ